MKFYRPFICFFVVSTVSLTCGTEPHKRAPSSGFTGVRGKKSIPEGIGPQATTPVATGSGKPTRDNTESLDIQKRSSPVLLPDESRRPFNGWIQDNSNYPQGLFKRAPSGFFGMRGKKEFYDELEKRAAYNNFFGMRGKKDNSPYSPYLYEEGVKRRVPSGFMGMRGKKYFDLDEQPVDFTAAARGLYNDEKRAAPAGFFGMRGKKDNSFAAQGAEENGMMDNKRAPQNFFGMRGRRGDFTQEEFDDEDASLMMEGEDKRVAANAFFGMRGKRDYEDYLGDSTKSFHGLRGKKHRTRSNFFGMRGKKFPSEFRGKFVGVRGKKSLTNESPIITENQEGMNLERVSNEDLDLTQLMFLLAETEKENSNGYEPERAKVIE